MGLRLVQWWARGLVPELVHQLVQGWVQMFLQLLPKEQMGLKLDQVSVSWTDPMWVLGKVLELVQVCKPHSSHLHILVCTKPLPSTCC